MRKIVVFYAWQSDTVQKSNRYLIDGALRAAAKRVADSIPDVEVIVDSDTSGVPGTPPVTEILLGKIAACDIFIPDVSFVAETAAGKSIPNPNVMLEYGYALHAKTYTAMMPVMNTAFGPPQQLPFDMGHLRHPIQFHVEPTAGSVERSAVRQALSKELEEKLRLQIAATQPPRPAPLPFVATQPKNGLSRFRVRGESIGRLWHYMSRFGDDLGNDISRGWTDYAVTTYANRRSRQEVANS
jgi:hypothetical protein